MSRVTDLTALLTLKTRSQSDESEILDRIAGDLPIPRTFVKFGFAPLELNCGPLIRRGFTGLLIDASDDRARRILRRRLRGQVEVLQQFLTVENIVVVRERFDPGELGVLSVDVDGNDYWLLKELLPLRPAVVVVEYNASFGPSRRVTVPYDPTFNRQEKHESGMYHGASLAAMAALCADYTLSGIAAGGVNAFFARSDFGLDPLDPVSAWRENERRNDMWGTTAAQQWEVVKDLPLVEV
jgi:hypothetical protein